MGRGRGPRFLFPIPGRKSHTSKDKNDSDSSSKQPTPTTIPTPIPTPTVPEWSPRFDEHTSYSKAERVLGTAGMPFRPSSRSQASLPQSPGFMTITVSEASFDSDYTDKSNMVEDGGFYPTQRPTMLHRPSSNILGNGYPDDSRRGSNSSSISRRIHPKTSNSTMRSYYDPQSSPLAISQQTSASAVRDMALRKGHPQVALATSIDDHVQSPSPRPTPHDVKNEYRKSKPARLDLSKLFPKPRASAGHENAVPLLSPNKLVNSPTAMSTVSDYFPRPMTREPTPTPRGQTKLTKTAKRQQNQSTQPQQRSMSPVRLHKRDTYDSAKINVRRPPRGIQHWFEGVDDDSDEEDGKAQVPVHAPKPSLPTGSRHAPIRKSSLGRLIDDGPSPYRQDAYHHPGVPQSRRDHFPQANTASHRLNSPSQFSVQSQSSLGTTRTKESAFSKSNLQDSSVLSMSSSEDEGDEKVRPSNQFRMRDSIGSTDDHGEIIIGQAQAFEVRPRTGRRQSESKLSMRTTSTSAATIEVMYTPEPYTPQSFPRPPLSSRRSSHMRQPSVIPEDEDVRPKTSANAPLSPSTNSVRSARTSASEPRNRASNHKLMAVTAEEEALLEMMRRKRAAMAKQSFSEGYETALKVDERQRTPPEQDQSHRTSGFLTMDSPSAGPARLVTTPSRKSFGIVSPLLQPPPRGRPTNSAPDGYTGTSMLRDSSSCDPGSARQLSPLSTTNVSLAHRLSPPPEFSPLDPFPSPTPSPVPTATEASIASPTTTDHASPLPSPITPGLRTGEADVDVKVASSEPSCSGDNDTDDVAVLDSGIFDPSALGIKSDESHSSQIHAHHQRRRTASSGADVPFSPPRKFSQHPSASSNDLAPVSEASSRAPSIVEPAIPVVPKRSAKRTSILSSSTAPRSTSSIYSTHSASSPNLVPSDRRTSRVLSRGSSNNSLKRDSVAIGTASTRCSVSEDVLAAWGSLGGGRIGGI